MVKLFVCYASSFHLFCKSFYQLYHIVFCSIYACNCFQQTIIIFIKLFITHWFLLNNRFIFFFLSFLSCFIRFFLGFFSVFCNIMVKLFVCYASSFHFIRNFCYIYHIMFCSVFTCNYSQHTVISFIKLFITHRLLFSNRFITFFLNFFIFVFFS